MELAFPFYMYFRLVFLFVIYLFFSTIPLLAQEISNEQKALVKKANTAKYRLLMRPNNKEFIRLINLYRMDREVLDAYVKDRYGDQYAKSMKGIVKRKFKPLQKLRPSFGLHLSSLSHAIFSGLTAYEGHRGMTARVFVFMNLSVFLPNNAYGENCYYGEWKAIDLFIGWAYSSGHNANMKSRDFYRIGVAQFFHFEYGTNTVNVFGGRNILGHIFINDEKKR